MSMDIVGRLRGTATSDLSAWFVLTNEAADEIERLRAALRRIVEADRAIDGVEMRSAKIARTALFPTAEQQ